ncbi:hypothetical protein D3248_01680 [Leucobacter zeae]|nr:hypothetical protein [Leucobacter zeae]
MAADTGVGQLTKELRQSLAELSPAPEDPLFREAWDGMVSLTNLAGARLLESRFGRDTAAAAEVQAYLFHLEKVAVVGREAPLQIPLLTMRTWKALGRYIDATHDSDELFGYLIAVPSIGAAVSEYASRSLGRHAAPLVSVLTLMVRAGSVYQDALQRTPTALRGM